MLCSFFCGAIPDLFAVKTLVKIEFSGFKVLISQGFSRDFSQRYILCEKRKKGGMAPGTTGKTRARERPGSLCTREALAGANRKTPV